MSTTWSITGKRSVKAVCTTGNEAAPANPAKASVTVAFSSAVAGNSVTVRGKTFTAIANGATPANGFEFAVGAGGTANTDTGAAFAAAVNALSAELGYTATNASGTVTLAALDYGTYANGWPITKVGAPITLGAAAFASGVDLVGIRLDGVYALSAAVEAVTASQTVASGKLAAYVLNDQTYRYLPCPGLDLPLSSTATQGQAFPASEVPIRRGFLAYVPVGVTVSSGSAAVYINAADSDGEPL